MAALRRRCSCCCCCFQANCKCCVLLIGSTGGCLNGLYSQHQSWDVRLESMFLIYRWSAAERNYINKGKLQERHNNKFHLKMCENDVSAIAMMSLFLYCEWAACALGTCLSADYSLVITHFDSNFKLIPLDFEPRDWCERSYCLSRHIQNDSEMRVLAILRPFPSIALVLFLLEKLCTAMCVSLP